MHPCEKSNIKFQRSNCELLHSIEAKLVNCLPAKALASEGAMHPCEKSNIKFQRSNCELLHSIEAKLVNCLPAKALASEGAMHPCEKSNIKFQNCFNDIKTPGKTFLSTSSSIYSTCFFVNAKV
ncbi:MAG: hypothetical protein U9O20_01860 [Patescibacteria group bacterium]|nr:hypothetical protein [Patescibacteria group bacterium]